MGYLSYCPLLLVVSSAGRVLAEQWLSCPGTASHTGSTGSRWEVIMNVAGERSGAAGQETAGEAGEAVPEFYVALEFAGDGRCCRPGLPVAPLTEAVARVTATGSALARITAPPPYGTFTGVTAAAGNRTFVLAAQKLARLPLTTPPATRFFLLRVDPASRRPGRAGTAGRRWRSRNSRRAWWYPALPSPRMPPGSRSPPGPFPGATGLHVFTLATGAGRAWDGPGVGPAFGPGAVHGCLSWAADGHTLALISSGAPSQTAGSGCWTPPRPAAACWPAAGWSCPPRRARKTGPAITGARSLISADGQVIVAVIQVEAHHASGRMPGVTQKLVTFSATTGTLLRELDRMHVHGGYEHVPGPARPDSC